MTGHGRRATVLDTGGPRLACVAWGGTPTVPRRAAPGDACRTPTRKKGPLCGRAPRGPGPSPEAAAATVATIPPAKVRSRFAAGLVLHERRLWVVALLALAAAFWWLNPT